MEEVGTHQEEPTLPPESVLSELALTLVTPEDSLLHSEPHSELQEPVLSHQDTVELPVTMVSLDQVSLKLTINFNKS